MKKIFLLLMIVALSLTSCARRYPTASNVQDAMESTVKVSVSIKGIRVYNDSGSIAREKSEIGWMGSGVVVAADTSKGSGESLIMTARHVAQFDPEPMIRMGPSGFEVFIPVLMEMTVQRLDGSTCDAKTIYSDLKDDISVVKASCIAGTPAPLANDVPEVGSAIMVVGAGLGYHPNGVFVVVDGRFLGFEDGFNPQMILSVPVAPGHSGSAVFYNGKVIGIVSKRVLNYEHISFAASLERAKVSLENALNIWNSQGEEEQVDAE